MGEWGDINLTAGKDPAFDLLNFKTELNRRLKHAFRNIDVTQILLGLSASKLVSTNAGGNLDSVDTLGDFIAGTSNRITVSNDGDGTITLSTPQDTHTSASPTFNNITGSGLVKGATGQFGNVAGGNYSSFESDGTLVLNGDAAVWDDLRIEPTIRGTATQNPTFEQYFTNGAGSRGVYLYSFTDEHTNEKEIHFTAQMPHGWKGTAIDLHIHWIPYTSQTGKYVKWGCEYTWANISNIFGNTTIITKNTNIQDETSLVGGKHYITAFDDITPSASQNGISSILIGRIFRNSSDATNDTYTDKCGILYIDIHYEIDTLGSRSEFSK